MTTSWKLWLDDLRNPSTEAPEESDFIWCRDVDQAKYYTRMWGPPTFMALDHDLGLSIPQIHLGGTRLDDVLMYLRWLERSYPDAKPEFRVHSANPVGQANIISFMESWRKSQDFGIASE